MVSAGGVGGGCGLASFDDGGPARGTAVGAPAVRQRRRGCGRTGAAEPGRADAVAAVDAVGFAVAAND